MAEPTNDNEGVTRTSGSLEHDTNGLAAILLVESLIHTLVAQSLINLDDAVALVEVAIDVIDEMSADNNGLTDALPGSRLVLTKMKKSLRIDLLAAELTAAGPKKPDDI